MIVSNPPAGVQINNAITEASVTILANTNSVTITHNFGYKAKIKSVAFTNDNASPWRLLNETVNAFDIAFQTGVTQLTDTPIKVSYV